ncbi:MAG: hypothetical protein KAT93_08855, partial [Desulfuromonadales bacterium]|nr:hypothetical protein [Desulfuromonadales bacterium]
MGGRTVLRRVARHSLGVGGSTISETETEYNTLGQVFAEIDANGNRTEYEYDDAGRKVVERNALLQETTYQYDGVGNVTMVTGPDG